MNKRFRRLTMLALPRQWRWLAPLLVFIVLLAGWEFVVSNDENVQGLNRVIERLTGWDPDLDAVPPTILPRPSVILRQLIVTPRNQKGGPAYFWRHTRATLLAAVLGFVVGNCFAIFTATLFLYFKPLERALMPVALALRSMPLVAITPLLLRIRFAIADLPVVQGSPLLRVVFGTDLVMKMIIVVVICYFPTLVNVARGLTSVEPAALELMHTLRASRWQVYWKLRVPTAAPLAFAAFRVASSSAVLGAVVAEWLSSYHGLGYVIKRAHFERIEPNMWAAMVISACLAISGFLLVNGLQRLLVPWCRHVIHLPKTVRESERQPVPR